MQAVLVDDANTPPIVRLTERQFRYCYVMCKMPIMNEEFDSKSYQTLQFVEFLEFIGRMAYIKFADDENGLDEPMHTRMEYIVDGLLEMIGVQRADELDEVADLTEDDPDY